MWHTAVVCGVDSRDLFRGSKCVYSCYFCQHFGDCCSDNTPARIESSKAAGSVGTYIVWQIYRYIKRRWFLFCKSVLFYREPSSTNETKSEWRCE